MAEQIVVSAGKECFYSANSLDAPEVSQAQACLRLLPNSKAAQDELSCIHAVLELQAFGVTLLPLAYCQVCLLCPYLVEMLELIFKTTCFEVLSRSKPQMGSQRDAPNFSQLGSVVWHG